MIPKCLCSDLITKRLSGSERTTSLHLQLAHEAHAVPTAVSGPEETSKTLVKPTQEESLDGAYLEILL